MTMRSALLGIFCFTFLLAVFPTASRGEEVHSFPAGTLISDTYSLPGSPLHSGRGASTPQYPHGFFHVPQSEALSAQCQTEQYLLAGLQSKSFTLTTDCSKPQLLSTTVKMTAAVIVQDTPPPGYEEDMIKNTPPGECYVTDQLIKELARSTVRRRVIMNSHCNSDWTQLIVHTQIF